MFGGDIRRQNVVLVRVSDVLAPAQICECNQDIVFGVDLQNAILHRRPAQTSVRPSPAGRLTRVLTRLISVICPVTNGNFHSVRPTALFNPTPFSIRIGRGLWSFEFLYTFRASHWARTRAYRRKKPRNGVKGFQRQEFVGKSGRREGGSCDPPRHPGPWPGTRHRRHRDVSVRVSGCSHQVYGYRLGTSRSVSSRRIYRPACDPSCKLSQDTS